MKLSGPFVSMNKETRSEYKINEAKQLPRGSGPREARLAHMALTHLKLVLRGEPNLRFKIPHKRIIKNQKKSMPRETEKH